MCWVQPMWTTWIVNPPKYFRAARNYGPFTGRPNPENVFGSALYSSPVFSHPKERTIHRRHPRWPQVVISDFIGLSDKMFLPS